MGGGKTLLKTVYWKIFECNNWTQDCTHNMEANKLWTLDFMTKVKKRLIFTFLHLKMMRYDEWNTQLSLNFLLPASKPLAQVWDEPD